MTIEGKIEAASDSVSSPTESTESCEEVFFNPNVFTEFKLAGSPEVNVIKLMYSLVCVSSPTFPLTWTFYLFIHQEIAADEENVRKASSYLTDVVLPKFIQDLCTLEVSPMDGQTLTEALHAHGINVRYIGKVSLS